MRRHILVELSNLNFIKIHQAFYRVVTCGETRLATLRDASFFLTLIAKAPN
jgi:hypothetical protein